MRYMHEAPDVSRRAVLRTIGGGAAIGAVLTLARFQAMADADPAGAVVGSWLIHSGPADRPCRSRP